MAGVNHRAHNGSSGNRRLHVDRCIRCKRFHSGICGIPPGVTLGFGARVGNARQNQIKSKKESVKTLKDMLAQARVQESELTEKLRFAPIDSLLDDLSKVESLILQLVRQITVREVNYR